MVRVDYADGDPETYLLPLGFAPDGGTQRRGGCADRGSGRPRSRGRLGGTGRRAVRRDLRPRARGHAVRHPQANPPRRARCRDPARLARGRLSKTTARTGRLAYLGGTNTVVLQDDHAALKLYRRARRGLPPGRGDRRVADGALVRPRAGPGRRLGVPPRTGRARHAGHLAPIRAARRHAVVRHRGRPRGLPRTSLGAGRPA